MSRSGARAAPLPCADLQFYVRDFLRCRKRELGFSLKERSKDQRDAGPMPRDGARAAPLPCADLQFYVRVFLRCRKRELGFSLKERSKDQRDAGPMPRSGAQAAPLPCAVLRFCVRVILRCLKRELGFSLKETKTSVTLDPCRGTGRGTSLCPEHNPWRGRVLSSQAGVSVAHQSRLPARSVLDGPHWGPGPPRRELSGPVTARSRRIFPMARK